MSDTNSLIDSLEKDEALKFFEGTATSATILKQEEKEEKKDNFHDSLEDDFKFSDFLPEKEKKELEIAVKEESTVLNLGNPGETEEPKEVKEEKETRDAVKFVSSLIDSKKLTGFSDDQPISTLKDVEELILGNIEEANRSGREEGLQEILQSLPPDAQLVIDYALKGATDMKPLFKALSVLEEVKAIDIKTEKGQEKLITDYLRAKKVYRSEEKLQAQVAEWKDLGKLEDKAEEFKEEYEEMGAQNAQKIIKEQETREKQQKEAARMYTNSIYEAVKDSDLNGIKLDKKTQSLLFNGLTKPDYESVTGENTNLLGHLLEKYQFVEPNYKLILEATWLLADPEGYKAKLRTEIEAAKDVKTIRQIKSAQGNNNSGTSLPEEDKDNKTKIKRTGFFNSFK